MHPSESLDNHRGKRSGFFALAEHLFVCGYQQSYSDRGRATVGFPGGSTPKAIYEMLGQDPAIDWSKVWIFLVDDRFIEKTIPEQSVPPSVDA